MAASRIRPARCVAAAARLGRAADAAHVIDIEDGPVRLGLAARLAEAAGARRHVLRPTRDAKDGSMTEPRIPEQLVRHGGDEIDVPHRPGDAGSAEPLRRKRRDRPLVIVLTGHGKGKSTSAFGMLMRSWARGYRCGVFQFVKSGKWKVGEAKAAAALGGIDWEKMGDGWSWLSKDLEESADKAREGWAGVKRMIAEERYEFLLLDEITYPIKWGWIELDDVIATLRDRPGFQHVILTGRDAPPELIAAADLASEVVKLKHPMDAGIRAQQGIEW